MSRFGKTYMRLKKFARKGDGSSTSDGPEPTSMGVPEAVGMTEEALTVGSETREDVEVLRAPMATETLQRWLRRTHCRLKVGLQTRL